ncbi:hypothetical protein GCM10022243_19820 [Saccharothrix violaceirubra]|uniref:Transcriptional regulator with XRE-family HTH domain n=1 Tax=Saccharothrix violaceirubra TaxID=413306 RepID=A0A7W7T242_9PSEU|nr:helix-turn-helix transcriptional regulator [Saccharothrix violaceirubra]MBB4965113.1 transcriptional regulator with XRE-family HTH domain [Saccharothrix violaceirubra]
MPHEAIGSQLRALRLAAGRTVASVAADAGLSVPYIANLENGRGNPTMSALSRLATALGRDLVIGFDGVAGEEGPLPPDLAKLGRSRRFKSAVAALAEHRGQDVTAVATHLLGACRRLGHVLDEPSEADWFRVLDAVLLIAAHPA